MPLILLMPERRCIRSRLNRWNWSADKSNWCVTRFRNAGTSFRRALHRAMHSFTI